jgi:pimeloyl-ACP methyl ester carboxylesterase
MLQLLCSIFNTLSMRYFHKAVLIFGLCLLYGTPAEAQTPLSDSFDTYAPGEIVGQGGWQGTTDIWKVTNSDCHNGSAGCMSNAGTTIGQVFKTGINMATGTWPFYFYASTTQQNAVLIDFGFGAAEDVPQSVHTADLSLQTHNGKLSVLDALDYVIDGLSLNAWHKIAFSWDMTDPSNCHFSLAADDGAAVPAAIASGDPTNCYFNYLPNYTIGGMRFWSFSSFGTTYKIDDVGVATTTPATTTPTYCTAGTPGCNSNVMFLPGIEGSHLYVDDILGQDQIWEPNRLLDDLGNLDLSQNANVYTRHGDVVQNFYGHYPTYQTFFSQLNQDQQTGVFNQWEPIAYDWRLDYQELLTSGAETSGGKIYYHGSNAATSSPFIIQELKRLASTSRTGKVTIIAHSNGGLLAKALLLQPGLSQYVDKVIMIDVPQLGTPQAVAALLNGFDSGFPFPVSEFFSDANARTLGKVTPVAYNLLPSQLYFQNNTIPVITFNQNLNNITNWKTKYSDPLNLQKGVDSESSLQTFMTDTTRAPLPLSQNDLNTPTVVSPTLFANAAAAHPQLDNWQPPQGVKLITIAGWGVPTLVSIEYSQKYNCSNSQNSTVCADVGNNITYTPTLIIEGDGTVVATSSMWTAGVAAEQYWVNLQQIDKTSQTWFVHANILEIPVLQTLLSTLITNGSTAFLPQNISKTKPMDDTSSPNTYFILHSPLTLGFTDNQGNYTGSTATTTLFNIPGVDYERFGEVQWLSVPRNLAGKVIMQGTGSGSFSLDIESVNGDTVLATTSFAGVPSATSTIATLVIDPSQSPTASSTLQVDLNGDGVVDTKLQAKQGSVVLPDLTPPEALFSADVISHDLAVTGVDDTSSTTVQKSATTIVITDQAGNKTTLTFQKTYSNNLLTLAKLTSIQYGNATPIALPTFFAYVWDSKQILLSQTVVADNQFVIQATYDKTKNKTTIVVLQKNIPIKTQTAPGLAIIKLTTNKGAINYSW